MSLQPATNDDASQGLLRIAKFVESIYGRQNLALGNNSDSGDWLRMHGVRIVGEDDVVYYISPDSGMTLERLPSDQSGFWWQVLLNGKVVAHQFDKVSDAYLQIAPK